jgi:hypothetical protein
MSRAIAFHPVNGWEEKAHRLVAAYSRQAWRQNRCKAGYRLPEIAVALVTALGMHDRVAAEHECKRLFDVERTGSWTLI